MIPEVPSGISQRASTGIVPFEIPGALFGNPMVDTFSRIPSRVPPGISSEFVQEFLL